MAKFDFQDVASHYDTIHLHSPEVSQAVGAFLATTVGQGRTILEIGVGTGRIARPVVDHGCQVVGIDVSAGMLAVAQQRGLDRLLIADMMKVPLATASVDAVLAVHVLHHASDWREALREVARVLKPGGLFIEGRDWDDPESCAMQIRGMMRQTIIELSPGIRPPGAGAARQQFLTRLGGTTQPDQVAARWQATTSPAEVIATMRQRNDPETWAIEPTLLTATLDRVEEWGRTRWPDFTAAMPYERRFLVGVTTIHHQAEPEQVLTP